MVRRSKETINVLMNIETYFGEHRGRMAPLIKFILVGLAPVLLGLVLPMKFWKIGLMIEVLWLARWALIILGDEKAKVRQFLQSADDEYALSDELARIVSIHKDGLIEYVNGEVAYVFSGYFMTYENDDALSIDVQNFLNLFNGFVYDVYCHNIVDEFRLQDNMESMKVYTDKDMIRERVQFYMLQDKVCCGKSKLYKINIAVKSYRYNWENLRRVVDNALRSYYAEVFKSVKVLTEFDEVNDVISRDLCTNVDMQRMLLNKYKNSEYFGSKVLFYGNEIPDKYRLEIEDVGIENRRITEEDGVEGCFK